MLAEHVTSIILERNVNPNSLFWANKELLLRIGDDPIVLIPYLLNKYGSKSAWIALASCGRIGKWPLDKILDVFAALWREAGAYWQTNTKVDGAGKTSTTGSQAQFVATKVQAMIWIRAAATWSRRDLLVHMMSYFNYKLSVEDANYAVSKTGSTLVLDYMMEQYPDNEILHHRFFVSTLNGALRTGRRELALTLLQQKPHCWGYYASDGEYDYAELGPRQKTLRTAAANGYLEILQQIIKSHPDMPRTYFTPALIEASEGRQEAVVQWLLDTMAPGIHTTTGVLRISVVKDWEPGVHILAQYLQAFDPTKDIPTSNGRLPATAGDWRKSQTAVMEVMGTIAAAGKMSMIQLAVERLTFLQEPDNLITLVDRAAKATIGRTITTRILQLAARFCQPSQLQSASFAAWKVAVNWDDPKYAIQLEEERWVVLPTLLPEVIEYVVTKAHQPWAVPHVMAAMPTLARTTIIMVAACMYSSENSWSCLKQLLKDEAYCKQEVLDLGLITACGYANTRAAHQLLVLGADVHTCNDRPMYDLCEDKAHSGPVKEWAARAHTLRVLLKFGGDVERVGRSRVEAMLWSLGFTLETTVSCSMYF